MTETYDLVAETWGSSRSDPDMEGVLIRRRPGEYARSEHPHEAVTLDFDNEGHLIAVEILASPYDGREPDGYRIDGGRVIPTDR